MLLYIGKKAYYLIKIIRFYNRLLQISMFTYNISIKDYDIYIIALDCKRISGKCHIFLTAGFVSLRARHLENVEFI